MPGATVRLKKEKLLWQHLKSANGENTQLHERRDQDQGISSDGKRDLWCVGIKSTSTAHKDIESLVKQGYLVKTLQNPGALMVVDLISVNTGESQPSAYDDHAWAH